MRKDQKEKRKKDRGRKLCGSIPKNKLLAIDKESNLNVSKFKSTLPMTSINLKLPVGTRLIL